MQVSKAKVWVKQAPWKRVDVDGQAHQHGESRLALPSAVTSYALAAALYDTNLFNTNLFVTKLRTSSKCGESAGYSVAGTETRTCYVTVEEGGKVEVTAGKYGVHQLTDR